MASLTPQEIAAMNSGLGDIPTTHRTPSIHSEEGKALFIFEGVRVQPCRDGTNGFIFEFVPCHVMSGNFTPGTTMAHFIQKPLMRDKLPFFARDMKNVIGALKDVPPTSLTGKEFEDEITRCCGIDPETRLLIGNGESPFRGVILTIMTTPKNDRDGKRVVGREGPICSVTFQQQVPFAAAVAKMTDEEKDTMSGHPAFMAAAQLS